MTMRTRGNLLELRQLMKPSTCCPQRSKCVEAANRGQRLPDRPNVQIREGRLVLHFHSARLWVLLLRMEISRLRLSYFVSGLALAPEVGAE